jgi:hypothetical protein
MSAIAQLGLDASGFIASIAASKAAVFGFKAAVDEVRNSESLPEGKTKQAATGIAVAIVALTVIMAKGTQMAIQFGASLVDVSYNTGLATSQVLALNLAVEKYGISSSTVVPATQKFNLAVQDAVKGTGPLVGILQNAGISLDDLGKMDTAARMQSVAQAIKAIKHPTEQAQAAMAIWGAEGVKFNEALQPGKINAASTALGAQAQLMEQNAGVFARISQVMAQSGSTLSEITAAAKSKIQGFFVGVASGLAPEILSILESVSSGSKSISDAIKEFAPALSPLVDIINKLIGIDFATIGQKIGKDIATTVEMLRSFNIKDLFKGASTQEGMSMSEKIKANFEAAAENIKKAQEEAAVRAEDNRKTILEAYKTPEKNVPTIEAPKATSGSNIDYAAGLSSLQKMGAVGMNAGPIIDPMAMQSVRIQTDIRDYMRTLVDLVKNPSNINAINPVTGGGMVLNS